VSQSWVLKDDGKLCQSPDDQVWPDVNVCFCGLSFCGFSFDQVRRDSRVFWTFDVQVRRVTDESFGGSTPRAFRVLGDILARLALVEPSR